MHKHKHKHAQYHSSVFGNINTDCKKGILHRYDCTKNILIQHSMQITLRVNK